MQKLIFIVLSVFIGMSTYAQENSEKILGKWTNEDQTRVIEFVKNGDEFEAIVRQAENPEGIGRKPITSLKYHKENTYKGGTVHIFARNTTAKCSAKIINKNELEIKAEFGIISRTNTWRRINIENSGT